MAIDIQPRDLKIMCRVFAHRVLTYDQVRRKYFPKCFETVSRNRIRKLVKHGFLRSFGSEHKGILIRCLGLTENAWPFISEKWNFDVDRPHFKSESFEHDFRLAEVVLKFEALQSFVSFLPENLLQSSSALATDMRFRDTVNLQSDGVLTLKGNNGESILYAVELEISKKTPDRYLKKLQGYYQASGIDGVLYICGNQEIATSVAQADRQLRTGSESIVFLTDESSVLKSEKKIIFKSVNGGGIGLV